MSRSRSFLILRLKVRGLPKILRTHLLPDIKLTGTGMQASLKVVNYCLLILDSHTSTCTSSQSSRFKGIVCSIFVESFYFYLLNTLWRNEFSRNLFQGQCDEGVYDLSDVLVASVSLLIHVQLFLPAQFPQGCLLSPNGPK